MAGGWSPKQYIIELIKKDTPNLEYLFLSNRRRPTFPGSCPPSIISAKELNYCVRDGNRCILFAIVTGSLACYLCAILCHSLIRIRLCMSLYMHSCSFQYSLSCSKLTSQSDRNLRFLKVHFQDSCCTLKTEQCQNNLYLKPLVKRSTY